MVGLEKSREGSGYVLSGCLGEGVDLERIRNALRPLGESAMDGDRITLEASGFPISIDVDGNISIGPTERERLLEEVGRRLESCIIKANHCVGCGTCMGSCHLGAIDIAGGKAWIGDGCSHCGSCIELCPLLTWAVKAPARPFG
jgi:phosphoadenosine phosphosulfate reductase